MVSNERSFLFLPYLPCPPSPPPPWLIALSLTTLFWTSSLPPKQCPPVCSRHSRHSPPLPMCLYYLHIPLQHLTAFLQHSFAHPLPLTTPTHQSVITLIIPRSTRWIFVIDLTLFILPPSSQCQSSAITLNHDEHDPATAALARVDLRTAVKAAVVLSTESFLSHNSPE